MTSNWVIKDSGMVLLIEMLHPERVGLRWKKRWDRGSVLNSISDSTRGHIRSQYIYGDMKPVRIGNITANTGACED